MVPGAALLRLLAPGALLHDGLLPPARAEPPPVPVKLAALPLREVGLVLAAGAVRVRGVHLGGHERGAGAGNVRGLHRRVNVIAARTRKQLLGEPLPRLRQARPWARAGGGPALATEDRRRKSAGHEIYKLAEFF